MKTLQSIFKGRLAPYFAGVISVFYFLAIGFRGFSESSLQWLSRSAEMGEQLRDSPRNISEWSPETHGLADVFAAIVYAYVPGIAEWVLFGLCVLFGALATGLVFALTQRLAGAIGGWMALFFLLSTAPWMGLFTRVDPTFLLVPVMLGFFLAWYAPTLSWWKRSLWCTPLLATGVLLWPGFAIIAGLVLIVELLCAPHRTEAESQGLVDGPTITVDRLLIPLGGLLLLLLYPLFWSEPLDGLIQYFLGALEQPAAEFVFRGDAYPPARPPLYTGAAWIFEQLPLAVVFAFTCGILWCFVDLRAPNRRLAIACAVVAAALLTFPVLFRSPRPLGAEYGVLFMATGLPVAVLLLCRFFSHALGQGAPSKTVRRVAIVTFLLAGTSILIETPRAVESPESFRSPMTARLVGWSASGDMPMREDILPLALLDSIDDPAETTYLYSAGWEEYLERYRKMRLLRGIETTPDPERADVAIRRVPPVAAGRFSVYTAPHIPPLEDSSTEVVPDIHRPLFLIDRRAE